MTELDVGGIVLVDDFAGGLSEERAGGRGQGGVEESAPKHGDTICLRRGAVKTAV